MAGLKTFCGDQWVASVGKLRKRKPKTIARTPVITAYQAMIQISAAAPASGFHKRRPAKMIEARPIRIRNHSPLISRRILIASAISVAPIGDRDSDPDWGFNLIIGILGVIVGLLSFLAPAITALALVIYIAAWALMIGATEIALAIKMRREIKGEWFLILMGLSSIIFAGLLLWNPLAGAAALIWIVAWYAVIMGVLAIIFGFRLRSLATLATR
jgi:hypothetical protein